MKLLLFLSLFFFSLNILAQDTRWIDLEWEAVPEAKEYQIELFQEVQGENVPRGKYKTDTPEWSHAVPPGKYSLRLRSVDARGVPGEWSENIPLKIRMKNPLLLRPVAGDKVNEPLIDFEWAPTQGAHHYQLVVRNEKKEVIHNALTTELKNSVYIESIDKIEWVVFALEKDEDPKAPDQWIDNAFRAFYRVPGILEAPVVSLKVGEKVEFGWQRVKLAQSYEVDYLPPPGSAQKNRRFRLKLSPLIFAPSKLSDGVTTLTIKSMAPGHKDSKKSIVKIAKSGNSVELQDIIQGKDEELFKTPPTQTFFRNELLIGVTLSKFSYKSKNGVTDTELNQKSLTGLGIVGEWNHRPALNSLNRKLDFAIQNLSSGIDSGIAARLGYTFHKEKKIGRNVFNYGAGLSYLGLPNFQGDRFKNKVTVNSSQSVGPDFQLGYTRILSQLLEFHTAAIFSYHPLFLSSDLDGGTGFLWMKVLGRAQYFYTEKQAFFVQVDYQSWDQKFSNINSSLSGLGINFGIQSGF